MNCVYPRRIHSVVVLILVVLSLGSGCVTVSKPESVTSQVQDASKQLADQLAGNLATDKPLRVGIAPFALKNGASISVLQALQEALKNRLFLTKRFDVVEDTDMQKVLTQLKIEEQGEGMLQEDTIKRMGNLLAADAIIVGTVTRLSGSYLVDCRLVPITSGVVGSAAETTVTDKDKKGRLSLGL